MTSPEVRPFRSIDPKEAESLVAAGSVRVLDVRTPEEFIGSGHIPGAVLLPLDLLPSAPATIARQGTPLLVTCEHGIRSAHAARWLAQAGYEGILNLAGGMSRWTGAREYAPGDPTLFGPSSWLLQCADLLPRGGRVLDVACGAGRHALLLAAAGYTVRAVDRDAALVGALREAAARLRLELRADVLDLETGTVDIGADEHDLIVVVHYLHRPLFAALRSALKPGGLLLYETYTLEQAKRGKPTNPAYLLEPGELPRLVAPLAIERQREGEFDGRMIASVAARKR